MAEAVLSGDSRRYRAIMLATAGILLLVFAIGAGLQAALLELVGEQIGAEFIAGVPVRVLANLSAAGVTLALLAVAPIVDRPPPVKVGWVVLAGSAGMLVRAAVQLLFGVHLMARVDLVLADMPAAAVSGIIAVAVGVGAADLDRRRILDDRRGSRRAATAAHALGRLRTSQFMGLARAADQAHDTLGEHLDRVTAEIRSIRDDAVDDAGVRSRLDDVLEELRVIRVRDLAAYRRMLEPDGVEVGLAPALRIMIGRIPAEIAVESDLQGSLVDADDPAIAPVPIPVRSLAVRALAVVVTTALERYRVDAFRISARVEHLRTLRIVVEDDGDRRGPIETIEEFAEFRSRLRAAGGDFVLATEPGALGGARIELTLDLDAPVPEPVWS